MGHRRLDRSGGIRLRASFLSVMEGRVMRVGIVGVGTIGQALAKAIDRGDDHCRMAHDLVSAGHDDVPVAECLGVDPIPKAVGDGLRRAEHLARRCLVHARGRARPLSPLLRGTRSAGPSVVSL